MIDIDMFKILTPDQKAQIKEVAFNKMMTAIMDIEITVNNLDISDILMRELDGAFEDTYMIAAEDLDKISATLASNINKVIKAKFK